MTGSITPVYKHTSYWVERLAIAERQRVKANTLFFGKKRTVPPPFAPDRVKLRWSGPSKDDFWGVARMAPSKRARFSKI